jgi:hypothetical protein
MAIVTSTVFKSNVATAAAALTTALQDDTVTRVALEISNPKHPLRQLEKYFTFNSATGVVASDDAYIDACYAGAAPSKGNPFDVVADWEVLALSTATVENAAPTDIVLTFSRDVANYDNIVLGGAGSAGKSITGVAIVDAVVTVTVSPAYANGDVITISGDFRTADSAKLTLTDQAVTNNVA